MGDYPKFGSIPRRYREITITEKIDGTNGLISITRCAGPRQPDGTMCAGEFDIRAGSRNRWLTVEDDNYGFASWVLCNTETLVRDLGEGNHYGEWWGSGIQRGYGLKQKRFSLFNTKRWGIAELALFQTPGLSIVPVIASGVPNTDEQISSALELLRRYGSMADFGGPAFMDPEGIVIWDHAAQQYQKVTLKNDEKPKGAK